MAVKIEKFDNVNLVLGDCKEVMLDAGVRAELGLPERFDAVVTDPPYGIGFANQPTLGQRGWGMEKKDWDDKTIPEMPALIACGDIQVVWGGNYYVMPISRGWLSWQKIGVAKSFGEFELAWTNQDRVARTFHGSISSMVLERCGHPTQKPLALMKWCLNQYPGLKSVCDPFMGSGTTGVACAKMGLAFTGIEIDEGYYQKARKRIKEALAQPDLLIDPAPGNAAPQEPLI